MKTWRLLDPKPCKYDLVFQKTARYHALLIPRPGWNPQTPRSNTVKNLRGNKKSMRTMKINRDLEVTTHDHVFF
jgi:hypothetical protein